MSFQYAIYAEPSMEVFQASDERIQKVVDTCPKWTREQFKQNIKPCDVIIPYKREKYSTGVVAKLFGAISRKMQGSSFSSCKIVGRDAKTIVGYGVDANATTAISSLNIEKFFAQHEAALVLRYKGITDDKRQKILDAFYKYVQTQPAYDGIGLVAKSIFAHWFGTFKKEKDDKEFSISDQKKLICSSIVLKVYQDCGLSIQHDKKVGDRWIWPSEFIISPSFTCIGSYFSRESGVKKNVVAAPEPEKKEEESKENEMKMAAHMDSIRLMDDCADTLAKCDHLIARVREIDDVLSNIKMSRDSVVVYGPKAIATLNSDGSLEALCGVKADALTKDLICAKFDESTRIETEARADYIAEMKRVMPDIQSLIDLTRDSVGYPSIAYQRAKDVLSDMLAISAS